MMVAAGLALFSALLGGAIALAARKRPAVLERTRTFAFAAAAGVVAFHLLPEVLPAQGLVALLWIGLGFALPWALEVVARRFGPGLLQARGFTGLRVAAEVGLAALVFHSVAEGLALVAALARPRGQLDLEIALVAHHAPLTAAVVLPFLDLRGPRSAGTRAVMVGLAGVAGVLLSSVVPGFADGAFLQVATAVTAGALLHVVSDEIRTQRFGSGWERAADLGACAAGLLVAGLSAVLHFREEAAAAPLLEFIRVLCGVALASAPALLFGTVVCALLAHRTRFFRWDAFLLALALLGPIFAMALAGFLVLGLFSTQDAPAPPQSLLAELLETVRRRAPAMLALLVVAAGLEVGTPSMPAHALTAGLLFLVVALCARLDQAGGVAVAAVLVGKGIDPVIAVALIGLGPFLRVPFLRARRGGTPWHAVALIVAGVAVLELVSGERPAATARAALSLTREPLLHQAAASPLGAASAAALFAIALATLWSAGVRGWFAPLRHGPKAA